MKLQDPVTMEQFQIELTNRFEVLHCNEPTLPIRERYESFVQTVEDVAKNVVSIFKSHGTPSWVSDRTIKLKQEGDEVKKKHQLSRSSQPKARWRQINASLHDVYQADKAGQLNKLLDELRIAGEKGDYSPTKPELCSTHPQKNYSISLWM